MSNNNDEISKHLNLPELKDEPVYEIEKIETDDDIAYVKDNIRDLISTGTSTLEILAQFAKNSENPKAFDVLATMIKTMLEANKDYTELSKREQENNGGNDAKVSTTNNNVFVGTTKDLQDMIEQAKNGQKKN